MQILRPGAQLSGRARAQFKYDTEFHASISAPSVVGVGELEVVVYTWTPPPCNTEGGSQIRGYLGQLSGILPHSKNPGLGDSLVGKDLLGSTRAWVLNSGPTGLSVQHCESEDKGTNSGGYLASQFSLNGMHASGSVRNFVSKIKWRSDWGRNPNIGFCSPHVLAGTLIQINQMIIFRLNF